jgi:hypothetical protein
VEKISNNMGRSFLAGVQALAPTIAGAARQGTTIKEGGDDAGGTLYSENNVAAIKGYCRVLTPAGIPKIWDAFQQIKELASHRHNLRMDMQRWNKQEGLDIDKAPFFTENSIKDIVGLKFNPVCTGGRANQGLRRGKTSHSSQSTIQGSLAQVEDATKPTTGHVLRATIQRQHVLRAAVDFIWQQV